MDEKRLLPDSVVCRRYGVSSMTVWRWDRDPALNFPKPFRIKGRKCRATRVSSMSSTNGCGRPTTTLTKPRRPPTLSVLTTMTLMKPPTAGLVMEKLVDELNWLLRLFGDAVDNLEFVQAIYANPSIETTLSDLRYAKIG